MTDFSAFCPVVNRPDLLHNALAATQPFWDDLTVIDNSPERWVREELRIKQLPVRVFTPPVPLSFTQSANWELEETLRRGKPFCVHFHNDAVIPEGACEKLLDYARNVNSQKQRWGIIYTLHDVLCVYNPKVYEAIGGYDTNFAAYFSDNDYFRRMDLAGWERIVSGIEVQHGPQGHGSQTINSDPILRFLNGVTFPLYRQYYAAKWGGVVGEETFSHPFNLQPID